MIEAKVIWTDNHRFLGQASSGHGIVVDGDSKTGSSPMELVLIGLCGCTGYDVASILAKKREPFTSIEVRAEGDRTATWPTVYTEIRLVYRVGEGSRTKRLKTLCAYPKKSIVRSRPC